MNQNLEHAAIAKTLLLVDDEAALLATTTAVLNASGYKVLQARDGIEAIEQYEAHQGEIGAVLMDVVMPRLNGIDAARRIREMDPSVKIILSTGYADRSLAEANPDAILPKPYKVSTLRSLVQQVLLGEMFDVQSTGSAW